VLKVTKISTKMYFVPTNLTWDPTLVEFKQRNG